jgi:hypothetical protein
VIGESFNTVLAFRDPTLPIVYENCMAVRSLLPSSRRGSTTSQMGALLIPRRLLLDIG